MIGNIPAADWSTINSFSQDWTATDLITVNKQFALSTRYSKMDIQNGQLCGIGTMSYTLAYNAGSLLHIAGNSYVMMKNSYIYGYALSIINSFI